MTNVNKHTPVHVFPTCARGQLELFLLLRIGSLKRLYVVHREYSRQQRQKEKEEAFERAIAKATNAARAMNAARSLQNP